MTTTKIVESLGRVLDTRAADIALLNSYYNGTQAAAFLTPEARDALGKRFRSLAINFPRLVVNSIAERMQVTGFRLGGTDSGADMALWAVWKRNDMVEASAQAHVEALTLGSSYVIVWAGANGAPLVTVESSSQVAVERDPATREVTSAIKRWTANGSAYAVVFERHQITRMIAKGHVPDGGTIPSTGWETQEVIPNPLGVVPVVPLVNGGRLLDLDGVSEMADVLDITDAINKVSTDMLVTSEFFARPRRWVTGLEVIEDEDGNVVNPFGSEAGRIWQSEAPDTKFGQFDAASLDGYGDALATLTQQIGALSGLPPHYLGLHGDQPASADAIRSAEASLVATCHARMRSFGSSWADVMRLVVAVRDGVDPLGVEVETVWADAETRTPAQAADAALKLVTLGMPVAAVMEETLGYSPAQIERFRQMTRAAALDAAGVDLPALLPE